MRHIKYIVLLFLFIGCTISTELTKKVKTETYVGWWIYGNENHIFKDEDTLEEWTIFFINEDEQDMRNLFLSVAEMEYFPLETIMCGRIFNNGKKKILEVADFEITYIQGCGDE